MAKLYGFENVLKPAQPKKIYQSASKGPLAIADMATKHIENALRGRFIAAFAERTRGLNFDELVRTINCLTIGDLLTDQTTQDLFDELNNRQR